MTEPGRTGTGEPEIVVLPDADRAADIAAERIAGVISAAAARTGRVNFATTGGSGPVGIYARLAADPLRESVPWQSVQVWWGDDRFVPRDHPLSNVHPFDSVLLNTASRSGESGEGGTGVDVLSGVESGVYVPPEQIHPFPCGDAIAHARGIDWCAASYAAELAAAPIRRSESCRPSTSSCSALGPMATCSPCSRTARRSIRTSWRSAFRRRRRWSRTCRGSHSTRGSSTSPTG